MTLFQSVEAQLGRGRTLRLFAQVSGDRWAGVSVVAKSLPDAGRAGSDGADAPLR